MNSAPTTQMRVLALDPFARGFGFVVLEGPANLVDWGMKEARRNKGVRSLEQVAELIEYYHPDVIVVEDHRDKGCRRCPRIRKFIHKVIELAASREVSTHSVSGKAVKAVFSHAGAHTKDEIADVITNRFSELAARRPPLRKPWMSEAEQMSIFDALAFALAFDPLEDRRRETKTQLS
jgi:Holliday junction resolvasome RuvABC endonuclease subunit